MPCRPSCQSHNWLSKGRHGKDRRRRSAGPRRAVATAATRARSGERGHRVTVVTGSRFRADVEKAGLAFVPVADSPDQHAILQRLLEEDPDQYLVCHVLWLGALPVALGAPGTRPLR